MKVLARQILVMTSKVQEFNVIARVGTPAWAATGCKHNLIRWQGLPKAPFLIIKIVDDVSII